MTYLLHGSANVAHDSAPNFQPDGVEYHLCKLLIRLYDCLVPSTKIRLSVKLLNLFVWETKEYILCHSSG